LSKTSDDDSSDDILSHTSGDITPSIYCKSSEHEERKLEEFQLVSILGKGSFGKVYLVYLPATQAYYAMKSIRKDIVLDNDSLENIKLEKLILLQVCNPFIVSMQFVY
jgi:serine/threonine protein kinase